MLIHVGYIWTIFILIKIARFFFFHLANTCTRVEEDLADAFVDHPVVLVDRERKEEPDHIRSFEVLSFRIEPIENSVEDLVIKVKAPDLFAELVHLFVAFGTCLLFLVFRRLLLRRRLCSLCIAFFATALFVLSVFGVHVVVFLVEASWVRRIAHELIPHELLHLAIDTHPGRHDIRHDRLSILVFHSRERVLGVQRRLGARAALALVALLLVALGQRPAHGREHLDVAPAVVLAAELFDRERAVEPLECRRLRGHALDELLGHGVLQQPLLEALGLERELGVHREPAQHVHTQREVILLEVRDHALDRGVDLARVRAEPPVGAAHRQSNAEMAALPVGNRVISTFWTHCRESQADEVTKRERAWGKMDGLKGRLEAAYREFHASAAATDNMNESNVTRSVDLWVLALRDAFYSPHKPAQDTSMSKFLLLERSLLEALDAISQQLHSAFWEFIVHCVIALSREPVADAEPLQKAPQVSAELPPVTPTGNTDVKTKRKAKQTRTKTQPNAPVAFVLVSALKKLVTGPESERNAQGCLLVRHGSTVLRQFCQHELDPQMRKVDIKLLVEILDLFQVDFVSEDQVRALVADLLATKQHSSVIKLVQSFRSRVDWDFADLMRAMIRSKDWGSAELVAKTFEEDTENKALAKMLVEEAIQYHDFKRAHRIVFNFGLQHDYPDIDQLYSRDALLKLIEKQKWALALAYVGSDATLQNVLLSHLVAAREWRHAMTLARDRMGMDDFDPEEQVQLSEQLAKNGVPSSLAGLPVNGYLELPLQQESIIFCETVEAVNEAASYINNLDPATQHMIGLDVEWRPTSTKIAAHTGTLTTTAVASILQIATKSKVFIIDLLTLHNCDFLFEEFLLRLFSSDRFLKVGFGYDSDLKVLHQTFPERDAFRAVAPFLELSSVIQKVFGATVGNSLSNATAHILGKPLDKRMQLSNWDERPLSHSQVVYAALDAFCLLQIVDNIQISGLTDDKGAITSWDDVASTMINIVGLSSPIDDVASIAEAVQHRMKYHAEWESKLHNHGVIESKDLVACSEVQVFWNNRMLDTSDEIDGTLGLLPTQELRPLLAVVEEQPMAYVAVNSICFFADEKPCVACIDSNSKLDTSRLAGICGISRRKVKLATAMECETIWGFSPGTVPPFGHRTTVEHPTIPIFVDVNLQDYDKWVTGSGAHDQLLVFSSAAFFRLISVKAISDIALQRNGVSRQHHQDESHSTDDSEAVNPPASDGVNEYKFLADTMVGRVGRWLRTIGIDCVIWGKKKRSPPVDSSFPDRQSALLALAAREQRIILTRDKKLADRRDAGACFVVSSDDPHQQFQEIKNHFALVLKREDMMTRCAVCNHKGFDIVDRDYVKQHMADVVGEGVLELVTDFWKCLACHKLYWVGPKYSSAYENMLAKFQDSTEV